MTGAGIAFILLGLAVGVGLSIRYSSAIYVGLYMMHLMAALFLWNLTLYRVSDSYGYYSFQGEFTLGTAAVGWVASYIRDLFSASYLDMYMVFHLAGYAGLVLMYRICVGEFLYDCTSAIRGRAGIIHATVFLPSLHIWTSVVGKDSVMFLGVMLCVWASLRPMGRLLPLVLGVAICFAIRPHVAALIMLSIALAVSLDSETPSGWKAIIFTMLVIALGALSPVVIKFVGLESLDSASVGRYVELRQAAYVGTSTGIDLESYPFPLQFFTYMYRPLFFDATNAMGIVVSFESVFYLACTVVFGRRVYQLLRSRDRSFFVTFNSLFWLISTSVFAATTSNLGIAMRQKTAFLPSFFVIIFVVHAMHERSLQETERAEGEEIEGGRLLAEPQL